MKIRTILPVALGAAPLFLASTAIAGECDVDRGTFAPGTWQAHGFEEFSESDAMGIMAGHREVRFDVTFDGAGVAEGGSFVFAAWGANVAYDESSGSEANWSVSGDISGVVSQLQVDGTFDMDMQIDQTFTDLNGQLDSGSEFGSTGPRDTSFTFEPDAGDCSFTVGTVNGPGIGADVRWTAIKTGRYRGPSPMQRYEEITRRAVELSSSEEVDLEPVIALLRDLIGLTRTMATLDSCEAVQIGVTTFNPHAAYARWVLRTALAQFAELVQNFDTQTIVTVMTLGFEASGLQAELCGGVYEDNNGTLALVDTELAGRLQQSVVTNDTLEFQRIAAAAYQLQLPQTLALLEQMAPL